MELRFVFDQHVSGPALRQLRERGIDVVHVAEVGLASATDPEIFRWAVHEGRIVVTRNYRDFAPLVDAYARQGIDFPGVLFYATSVRHGDVGHHVRALLEWIDASVAAGRSAAASASAWLR
ncbi:MAG TPA: DUF5615 family PIN-like protein [Longimicrobiaceae bacterium]|nr:DUF5615 family PIN-like protein [Longimicrobiaceae bacterium]